MCPFCLATALWIAAGVSTTGGVCALAMVKLKNSHAHPREQGESNDHQ
jgi:hypothetical protein